MLGYGKKKVVGERDELVSRGSESRSGRGVYGISVAAELSGIGEQSLRLYEQRGLLTPARTAGGTRRYSEDDLARLRRITDLLAAGVNMAGIGQILDLQDRNSQLECDNTALRSDNVRLTATHRNGKAPIKAGSARKGSDRDKQ
jgi:MerR family transcriptional regulator/heat shock protein HspR